MAKGDVEAYCEVDKVVIHTFTRSEDREQKGDGRK